MNEVLEKIKARALTDEGYKQKLFADPVSVLSAEGVEIPGPLAGVNGELSLNQLDQVSAGDGGVMGWISQNVTGPIWQAIVDASGGPAPQGEEHNAGVRG
jgi:hypothetical protein